MLPLLSKFFPFRLQCCLESRRVLLIMYLLSFFIDLVPSKLQKELKLQYNSMSELLRHFWSCFPVKTQFLEEKVRLNMLKHTVPLAAGFCSADRSRRLFPSRSLREQFKFATMDLINSDSFYLMWLVAKTNYRSLQGVRASSPFGVGGGGISWNVARWRVCSQAKVIAAFIVFPREKACYLGWIELCATAFFLRE